MFLQMQQVDGPDMAAVQSLISTDLRPHNLADMRAFLNLSGFLNELLPQCGASPLTRWETASCPVLVAIS
jgi:hypothetical protein